MDEKTKEAKPTAGFQRIIQRAALHSQASGYKAINGSHVLAEFFFEHKAYALLCSREEGLSRQDILDYIKKKENLDSNEITKNPITKITIVENQVKPENKEKFGDTLEEILKDPTTEPYQDVSMRGIKGHGYYTENYGESGGFVGIQK